MLETCKICGEPISAKNHFYRAHKLTLEEYVYQYFPKKDKLTDEQIQFKSEEQYENTNFVDRRNMKKWLLLQTIPAQKEFVLNLLRARIKNKQLKFAPSFVEIKSLNYFPAYQYIDELFDIDGGWGGICKSFGLDLRFSDAPVLSQPLETKEFKVIVDTREQNPPKLGHEIEVGTLNFADYTWDETLVNPEKTGNVYIERKSLVDFINSFGGQVERLEKEVIRAKEKGAYIVVLVEEKIDSALAFNKLPWVSKKIKVSPDFVFKNVRDLLQKHDNLQFLFADGRIESARLLERVLEMGENARKLDLQFLFFKGKI